MERVVIFGASRGLGAELSKHIQSEDIPVAGWSRKDGDLSKIDGQKRALSFLGEQPVSKIFCIAGGGPYGPYHKREWKDHEWAWQVTFAFPAQVLHWGAGQPVKPQVILIGSSVAEASADPLAASYCAAKHALKGLFVTLRAEYPGWDVRLFSPGYMDTELLPKNAAVRRSGVYDPAQLARELWRWTLTADATGHKMYANHPDIGSIPSSGSTEQIL